MQKNGHVIRTTTWPARAAQVVPAQPRKVSGDLVFHVVLPGANRFLSSFEGENTCFRSTHMRK